MRKITTVCLLAIIMWLFLTVLWETIVPFDPTIIIKSLTDNTKVHNGPDPLSHEAINTGSVSQRSDLDQSVDIAQTRPKQSSTDLASTNHTTQYKKTTIYSLSTSSYPPNNHGEPSTQEQVTGSQLSISSSIHYTPMDKEQSNVSYVERKNLTRERKMPEIFKKEPEEWSDLEDPSLKKILFWNDMYSKHHYSFGLGREPFVRAGCTFNKCVTTSNRTRFPLSEIDALVWHFRASDKELPSQRSNHTRYVFLMQESPMNLFGDVHPYDGVFNWTFTYRLDSDFPSPAGFVVRRSNKLGRLSNGVATRKSKMVAWFVSNCKSSSNRESLVRTLQNQLPVDIYGECGQLRCKRSQQSKCYQMLEQDYKFYLSFENSLCRDYITEKFFHILQYNVVPIVWGLGNYSLQAPRHSFIDAADFESVEELAKYLNYLDKNTTAYMEYFEWKTEYEMITGWAASVRPWCDLCERLHKDQGVQVYDELSDWFNSETDCELPTSSSIARFTHGEHVDSIFNKL